MIFFNTFTHRVERKHRMLARSLLLLLVDSEKLKKKQIVMDRTFVLNKNVCPKRPFKNGRTLSQLKPCRQVENKLRARQKREHLVNPEHCITSLYTTLQRSKVQQVFLNDTCLEITFSQLRLIVPQKDVSAVFLSIPPSIFRHKLFYLNIDIRGRPYIT